MITAEKFLEKCNKGKGYLMLTRKEFTDSMIAYAKLAIEEDRKNLLNHVKVLKERINPMTDKVIENEIYCSTFFREDIGYEDYIPVDFTVDKESILNAPQIELL